MPALVHLQPITPRGGPRLRRAALAAFNRVPGRVGRYNVRTLGNVALLSEVRDRGELPLLAVTAGGAMFMVVPGAYTYMMDGDDLDYSPVTREEMRDGFPFNRMAALWNMLNTDPVPLVWSRQRLGPVIGRDGRSEGITANFRVFNPGYADGARHLDLPPDFRATFYGARAFDPLARDEAMRVFFAVDSWADVAGARGATRSRIMSRWRDVLRCGSQPSPDGASAPDVLADVGLEPEIWSSDTDPGGEGDPVGDDDGDRDSDGDDYDAEVDEDGNELPRPRPRRNSAPMPGIPRTSFAAWETSITDLNMEAEARAETIRALRRQELEAAQARRAERIRAMMNADDDRPQAPECSHCSDGLSPGCDPCQAAGRCMSCGRDLEAAARDRALAEAREALSQQDEAARVEILERYAADAGAAMAPSFDAAILDGVYYGGQVVPAPSDGRVNAREANNARNRAALEQLREAVDRRRRR